MLKKVVFVAAVLAVTAVVTNAAWDPNTDPDIVGHWTFDEGSGKIAADDTGHGNDGTLMNGTKWVDGVMGGAVEFDGTDDYVDTTQTENLTKWTISCWVKSPAAPGSTSPTGPMHRESNYQINWNHSDAVFRGSAAFNNGGTWYAAKLEPMEADTWYHLAATYDGDTLCAYRDGQLITANATPTGNPSAESNTLKFGRHASAAQYFRGTVDDARLYRRALTADEIQVLAPPKPPQLKAFKPDPADGTLNMNAMMPLFRWTAGVTGKLHNVYMGTDPNLTAANLVGPRLVTTMYYHILGLTAGTKYYWRVDEIEVDGTTIHTGDVWTFETQALTAYHPTPADGANTVFLAPTLTWLGSASAIQHKLYFGDTADAVAQGSAGTEKATLALAETAFDVNNLEPLTSYFWRVDEIEAGQVVKAGSVWQFVTALPIDDFESYTDDEGNRIYETWEDGYVNDTGATVGYLDPPFAELVTVHGGLQSMPLDYNNIDEPFYSEAERTFTAAQDWTADGADTLVLSLRGRLVNKPAGLYITLTDASNKSATVVYPDPAIIRLTKWTQWQIPLSDFAGVNAARIKKMTIGLGDRANPQAGGKGVMFIDDIMVTKPSPTN